MESLFYEPLQVAESYLAVDLEERQKSSVKYIDKIAKEKANPQQSKQLHQKNSEKLNDVRVEKATLRRRVGALVPKTEDFASIDHTAESESARRIGTLMQQQQVGLLVL